MCADAQSQQPQRCADTAWGCYRCCLASVQYRSATCLKGRAHREHSVRELPQRKVLRETKRGRGVGCGGRCVCVCVCVGCKKRHALRCHVVAPFIIHSSQWMHARQGTTLWCIHKDRQQPCSHAARGRTWVESTHRLSRVSRVVRRISLSLASSKVHDVAAACAVRQLFPWTTTAARQAPATLDDTQSVNGSALGRQSGRGKRTRTRSRSRLRTDLAESVRGVHGAVDDHMAHLHKGRTRPPPVQ